MVSKRTRTGRLRLKIRKGKKTSLRKAKVSTVRSWMTVGYTRTKLKYNMNLFYGADSNSNMGYVVGFIANGTQFWFPPTNSTNPGNVNQGTASNFFLPDARNINSSPGVIGIGGILGADVVGGVSAANLLANYKWMKISGLTVGIANIQSLANTQYYTSANPPVAIPTMHTALGALPNVFFNVSDNVGLAQNGFDNLDQSMSSSAYPPWGQPQKSIGSLKFRPHATNDKYAVTRYFKFTKVCLPTQLMVTASGDYRTIGGLGHWIPTLVQCLDDPINLLVPFFNGGVIWGQEPTTTVPVAAQNVNYVNFFVPVAELEFTFDIDWCGQYSYINVTGQ